VEGFRTALAQYLIGDLEVTDLETAIDDAMNEGPETEPQLTALLDDLFQSGRLPHQIYALLKRRIEQFAQPGQASGEERTQFAPPSESTAVPPAESSAPPDDATRIMIPQPPVTGDPTGPQTGAGLTGGTATGRATTHPSLPNQTGSPPTFPTGPTGAPTGQSGWSNQSQASGVSGSNWSHPSQWSGAQPGQNEPVDIGTAIKGRFVLEEVIGQGGMGRVFRALDLRKQEAQDRFPYVAVKILNEDFKQHPQALQALQRESAKAQDLAHPNVVTVFDFDRDGDNVFMTMEFLEGESLDKFVKRHVLQGISTDKAIDIVRSLADGLAYAHAKGIVHSDFKPANAFLTNSGVVKIFDFGIARAAKRPTDLEGEKTLFDAAELGALTPAYASCEMIEGGDPDARDDIYALAIVAYELMAGRHPFDKKSAVAARDAGMVPEPIKGLSRKQWRAVQHGLAFDRNDRSPTVEAFMAELDPQKISRPLIGIAALLVVGITAALLFAVPQYLEQRDVDSLIADINSGNDATLTTRIAELQDLREQDASIFRDVFVDDGTQDRFIDYYERRVRAVWNPGQQQFLYPQAEILIEELEGFFSDSRKVGDLRDEILVERGDMIAELYTNLNALLAEGVLIPDQGDQNVTSLLNVLRQISPEDERLGQQDIPIRFAQEAQKLQQAGQLGLAEQILNQGLSFSPDDIALVNVRDAIASKRDLVAREGRIEELEALLSGTSPADAATAELRSAISELTTLEPDSQVLARARERTQSYLSGNLDELEAQGDYGGARSLLVSYEGIASDQFMAERSVRLDRVAEENRARIDILFAELQEAVNSDRLDSGSGNAKALLDQLTGLAATADRLSDARTQIAAGYSRRATRAQQNQQWDEAREQLRAAIAMNPAVGTRADLTSKLDGLDELQRQSELIAEGDRQRLMAEQRQQEIDDLQSRFETILARGVFGAEDAREALVTIQDLSTYEAQIANGEQRVADRLTDSVNALFNAGQFDEAVALATQGSQILPRRPEFGALIARVESERSARAAEIERQRLGDLENLIAGLLSDAVLDQAWDQATNQALTDYAVIVGEGSRELAARRTRVAELYAEDAQRHLDDSRLVPARQQLDKAERFAPDLPLVQQGREALALQQTLLAEQTAARAQEAEINNQQLTLEAEATAGNMDAAIRIFEQLQSKGPNDEYVTAKAPRIIATGYARLGLTEAKSSGGIGDAAKLLEAARNWSTDVAEVGELDRAINEQAEATLKKVSGVMLGNQPLNVPAISNLVGAIRVAAPATYAEMTPELIEGVLAKVGQMSGSQARRRLEEAREIFPDEAGLQDYAPGDAVVSGDPCGRPDLVGNGGRRGGSCRDPLPGGNRGPALVVVPAGGPFSSAVAFSKFEISIRDYNIYCEQTGSCGALGGDPKLPLTQVSAEQAERFVQWLGEASGAKYRIPSSAEWVYAANANGDQPKRNWNCRVSQNNILIKGIDLVTVDSGEGNGWGLYNYVGNAQEWVRNGSGWEVRGGAFTHQLEQCDIDLSKSHSGKADKVTGFRVVRELG